ncbi:insulinase family protein [Mucilaginibacter mali]|uniref:Insulinase family protein n=1 Tax=Mucilaginibacter mali TaxID=2740462 RepID=A0A7D4QDH5_9SPHI|nr:pitrilysin family protein [Mucilaginibacter mali]QKJ31644.1 insulinase family protein [Mucilaginibacter mali]
MTLKLTKQLMLCAFVLLSALSVSAQTQPRLQPGYFWKKLPNGLEVVVIENHKVPLATIEIAVKNGAYTEGPEYSGLSHLFEHMFFKANKDFPTQEKLLHRIQELGAIFNGTTDVERVNYFFTFNADSLKGGLNFLNSCIRFPIYRAEDMAKERPVVDGEFQRAESDPGFLLSYETSKYLWGDQITRKNAIGIHEIINTATPEKMMIIKDKYYYPNNSLLTICGDVEHEKAFKLAESIFGSWQSSGFDPHVKYPIPPFEPVKKSVAFVKESSIAQTPYMNFSWQGPSYAKDSAATLAADVFNRIMALNSSKFRQALVDKRLAVSAGVSYGTTHYTGEISMFVVPNPEKMKECFDEVNNQIAQWTSADYFTDEQLSDAIAALVRAQSRAKEKPSSLNSQLSYAWCSESFAYDTDLADNYKKVTRADIKRYVDTYIAGKPLVSGIILKPEVNKQYNVASFFVAK